jgi:hypothetical protein
MWPLRIVTNAESLPHGHQAEPERPVTLSLWAVPLWADNCYGIDSISTLIDCPSLYLTSLPCHLECAATLLLSDPNDD